MTSDSDPHSESRSPSQGSADPSRAEWLSALADGEAQALEPACLAWREDEQARRTWHTYHLIGDVMRSDELACEPARNAAFMRGLRERLAQEPVVLAPQPLPASTMPLPTRPAWRMPAALAAGLVLVSGVMVVARMGPAVAPAAAPQLAAASAQPAAAQPVQAVVNGQMMMVDPRLNEFLRAHQAAAGGMAAPAPGGSLRRAEMIVTLPADR